VTAPSANVPAVDGRPSKSAAISNLVSVDEGYARWASTYDDSPNPLLALEQRSLLPLLPNITGKLVLDLACGTGRWLNKLLAANPALGIGIDRSRPMLHVAQEKAGITGRLAQADCLRLPFSKNTFDLAVCSFAVEHIRNLGDLATECSCVLKQSADLFITGLHPTAYSAGWRVAFRDGQGTMQIDVVPHTMAEIVKVFESAGFRLAQAFECFIGESERPLFIHAEKEYYFDVACSLPAIMILHFRHPSRA
jgi:ubiquinone/menaquinone biosynthesis C-methylase UbiE